MFGLSVPHLAILALVVLVLFGRGRVSATMGDFGKGIREFRNGMSGADDARLTEARGTEAAIEGLRQPEPPTT